MRGVVPDKVPEWLAVRVDFPGLDRIAELRLVAAYCVELLFEGVGDVDDESWFLMVFAKGKSVQNL